MIHVFRDKEQLGVVLLIKISICNASNGEFFSTTPTLDFFQFFCITGTHYLPRYLLTYLHRSERNKV